MHTQATAIGHQASGAVIFAAKAARLETVLTLIAREKIFHPRYFAIDLDAAPMWRGPGNWPCIWRMSCLAKA